MRVVFLIGRHGAGKTTFGRWLHAELGWTHISLGNLARLARAKRRPQGMSLRFMGELVKQPVGAAMRPALANALLESIQKVSLQTPVVVDGFPSEAAHVLQLPPSSSVVHVTCTEREKRLLDRQATSGRIWTPGQQSLRDELLPDVLKAVRSEDVPLLELDNSGDLAQSCSVLLDWVHQTA